MDQRCIWVGLLRCESIHQLTLPVHLKYYDCLNRSFTPLKAFRNQNKERLIDTMNHILLRCYLQIKNLYFSDSQLHFELLIPWEYNILLTNLSGLKETVFGKWEMTKWLRWFSWRLWKQNRLLQKINKTNDWYLDLVFGTNIWGDKWIEFISEVQTLSP